MNKNKEQLEPFKLHWFLLFGPAYLFDRHVAKKGGYTNRESYGILILWIVFLLVIIASILGWI